ncbi:MAG: glycine--tRNA ligase [Candidatus Gracilibacteria bacterium]|nr:glycine--tRNA ligase [Candidatus Gracilibacteria bacterium]
MSVEMKDIVDFAKLRGFVYQGSEIYGGLANTWDYGPYGSILKENLKNAWIKSFVQEKNNMTLLDAAIFMNPQTWVTSGHVGGFADPLMDCKSCKQRLRADKIIEEYAEKSNDSEMPKDWAGEKTPPENLTAYIKDKGIKCPFCGGDDFTEIRQFGLMFKTHQGVLEDNSALIYLRPETAQGIFVNFANVLRTSRKKVPFGIAQVGKAFRNEITPGNFVFRTREFEQMEIEFFCEPGSDIEWHEKWKTDCMNFLTETIGLNKENLRFRDHGPDELSFYSNATSDIEYKFPFGWGELWGIADRTDYDLKAHMTESKADLSYFDPVNNKKYIPYVIEPSLGLNRLLLTTILSAYDKVVTEEGERVVLRINPKLAPVKIGILPIVKKLSDEAMKIYDSLSKKWMCEFDETGAIGKRYYRFDEIGTPYCLVVDNDTVENGTVTVRDRDTGLQDIVKVTELEEYFRNKLD